MDTQSRYNTNTHPLNSPSEVEELLRCLEEEMLGTVHNEKEECSSGDIQCPPGATEQQAVYLSNGANLDSSGNISDSHTMSELKLELDAYINGLNSEAISSQTKPVMTRDELDNQFLMGSEFRSPPVQREQYSQAIHGTTEQQGTPSYMHLFSSEAEKKTEAQSWDSIFNNGQGLPDDTSYENRENPASAPDYTSEQHTASDANGVRTGSGLPSFPDVSVFDTNSDLEDLPKSVLQNEKKKRGPGSKILRVTAYIIVIVLMVFSIFIAINQATETPMFGYRFYNVISNSMEGMISKGSLVLTKETPVAELISGDVITFNKIEQVNSEPITHQIIEITSGEDGSKAFVTKGYNNSMADPSPVKPEMILGKVVFHMPIAGSVFSFIAQYMFLILVILMIGTAGFLLFFVPNKAKKNEEENIEETHEEPCDSPQQPSPEPPVADVQPYIQASVRFPQSQPDISSPEPVVEPQLYTPYFPPVPVSQSVSDKDEFAFSDDFEIQPEFNKTADDFLAAEPTEGLKNLEQVLENLQAVIYRDSEKELKKKVEDLLERKNERVYSDLQAVVAKINNDQNDLLSEIDRLINN